MFTRTGSFYRQISPRLYPRATGLLSTLVILSLGLILTLPALADRYSYQDRGDRREGIRAKPVSGDDIELISVRAEPVGGPVGSVPEHMHLTFFLPADEKKVQVIVRELDYEHYYWLDRVRPTGSWEPGETNSFRWPTRDVLRWLYGRGLQPADLGAVVRLAGSGGPSARERVAPAVLSGDGIPVAVRSWLFTFKTNFPARLTCGLYPSGAEETVWSKTFKRVGAGRPFSCRVPVAKLARGDYRLEVDGWSLETNDPVLQEVRFFHSPDLK